MSRFVEVVFAGLLMLTADVAPDVVAVWAQAGALAASRTRSDVIKRI
jgi:hypothetical protein